MDDTSESECQAAGSSEMNQKKRDRDKVTEVDGKSSLKKARYSWQVKGLKKDCTDENSDKDDTLEENNNPQSHDTSHEEEVSSDVDCSFTASSTVIHQASLVREALRQGDEGIIGMLSEAGVKMLTGSANGDSDEEGMSLGEHQDRGRNRANNYWERRAPFDIFSSTVNMVTSPTCHWQKQELGCAIVDNVFNRTLEEIGISPDPKVNKAARFIERALENQGIESAIRLQGLRSSISAMNNSQASSSSTQSSHQEDVMKQNSMSIDDNEINSTTASDILSEEEDILDSDSIAIDPCKENMKKAQHHKCTHNVTYNTSNSALNADADLQEMEITQCRSESEEKRVSETDGSTPSSTTVQTNDNHTSDSVRGDKSEDTHSDYMLDLAVSTAILSQGLAVNTK